MKNENLKGLSRIYEKSGIPVVIFSGEMVILWNNLSFGEYFPGVDLENKNISALTRTQFKSSLNVSKGYSGRFQLLLSSESRLSSSIVLLVFPAEISESYPSLYIGYVDDLTIDMNKVLRKTYLGLLEASKLKDDDTGNHIKRVGAYARNLSEECFKQHKYPEITPDFIESINFLAPMHDVGKIGTPDEILNKRGPLDEGEWAIMKQHTINGALILSNYPDPMAAEIARSHHERWDGTGYIFGLAGTDIPLAARITAIADVYDALRMKRSYKDAFSHEKAVGIIKESSGTHFDPDLIDIFLANHIIFDNIFTALSDDAAYTSEEIEELPAVLDSVDDDIEELEELEEI